MSRRKPSSGTSSTSDRPGQHPLRVDERPISHPRPSGAGAACDTTTEPSPTAEATRLTDPLRTSPMAKTPGSVVSYGCGLRCSDHWSARGGVGIRRAQSPIGRAPRLRKPVGAGSAPIITNRPLGLQALLRTRAAVSHGDRLEAALALPPTISTDVRTTTLARLRSHRSGTSTFRLPDRTHGPARVTRSQ